MATSYDDNGVTTTTETQDNLIAGDHILAPLAITLGEDATYGNLSRGAVLGKKTADGKYYIHNPSGSDGTQTPVAILAEAKNATAGDKKTVAYKHGEFNFIGLSWRTGTTYAQKNAAIVSLESADIYVRYTGRTLPTTTTTTTTTSTTTSTTTTTTTTTTTAP